MTIGNSNIVHHPNKTVYTVRELAALQTFPHDFEFMGTYEDQCRQIGNDVPPNFAEILFTHVLKQVEDFDEEEQRMAA